MLPVARTFRRTFCGRLDVLVVSSYSGTIVYYSAVLDESANLLQTWKTGRWFVLQD